MLGHFFMEPATINYPFEKGPLSSRFRYICKESMLSGVTHQERNAALPVNCVKPSVRHRICSTVHTYIFSYLLEVSILKAITIEAEPRPDGSRRTTRYDIDMNKYVDMFFLYE
ncbi:hypothetical protein ANCCEY_04872 [Ancylostoma ceylanicum]|uniref:Uncharacterized protein n=1 Tax=Ancylostoma ceylanicum TaxID=53326 RepID=A0A0D6M109_9BILA|nr:hypothetical protein ANCCEY_04872 [Ancylostoma ceylanicum]